jgi:hypothetical protein
VFNDAGRGRVPIISEFSPHVLLGLDLSSVFRSAIFEFERLRASSACFRDCF